jgi:hypothetical protein
MSGKGGDRVGKALEAMAGAAAGYLARKLVVFAWRQVTGQEPPEKDPDHQVSVGHAVAWAMLAGASVGAARVLATRFAHQQAHRRLSGPTN